MTPSRRNWHRRFCCFIVDYDVRRSLAFLSLNLNHFYTSTKSFAMFNAVIAQFATYCQIKWPFSDITSSGLSTRHFHSCATHHAGFKASWKWSFPVRMTSCPPEQDVTSCDIHLQWGWNIAWMQLTDDRTAAGYSPIGHGAYRWFHLLEQRRTLKMSLAYTVCGLLFLHCFFIWNAEGLEERKRKGGQDMSESQRLGGAAYRANTLWK